MSKSQRRKGQEREREFARAIGGRRVPLSGASEGYPGDVVGLGLTWEVKVRADGNGFKQLYGWLEGVDALAVRADRRGWLVVLPLEVLLALIGNPVQS